MSMHTRRFALVAVGFLLIGLSACSSEPNGSTTTDVLDPSPLDMQEDVAVPPLALCGGVECGDGEECCGEACVDLAVSMDHCGACSNRCEDIETCQSGACLCTGRNNEQLVCADAESCCPGMGCLNTSSDPFNCGGCGVTCGVGEVCSGGRCNCGEDSVHGEGVCLGATACCGSPGQCVLLTNPICSCGGVPCGVGQACCDEQCADLERDEANCGACGVVCGLGQVCGGGRCVCHSGFSDCDGEPANGCETNFLADHENCGACGHLCDAGQVCSRGSCQTTCQVNLDDCAGDCVDLLSDRGHCGACGNECPAGELCSSGFCVVSCQNELDLCGGRCVNLLTNRFNCGACGRECPSGEVCWAAQCTTSCPNGMAICDQMCVDLMGSVSNCGGCGNLCETDHFCVAGACALSCPEGLSNCGENCVDLGSSPANCGACGATCALGQVCADGHCVGDCPAGQLSCGGQCVDPMEDINFCGATTCADGTRCIPNQSCNQGTCECGTNFQDCNGDPADGCEAHTPTDESHCGGCFAPCDAGDNCCSSVCVSREQDVNNCGVCGLTCASAPINAVPACDWGTCSYICGTNFGDCDANPANGCERDLRNSTLHCGACNHYCPSGQVCNTGTCSPCPLGTVACNGACIDPKTSQTHCGAFGSCLGAGAGVACGSGLLCNGLGVCESSCAAGHILCNGLCIDPNTNSTFCGAVGNCIGANNGDVCPAGQLCDGTGTCGVGCATGLVACGGVCINPMTNTNFCGASADCLGVNQGTRCTLGVPCASGVCRPPADWYFTVSVYNGDGYDVELYSYTNHGIAEYVATLFSEPYQAIRGLGFDGTNLRIATLGADTMTYTTVEDRTYSLSGQWVGSCSIPYSPDYSMPYQAMYHPGTGEMVIFSEDYVNWGDYYLTSCNANVFIGNYPWYTSTYDPSCWLQGDDYVTWTNPETTALSYWTLGVGQTMEYWLGGNGADAMACETTPALKLYTAQYTDLEEHDQNGDVVGILSVNGLPDYIIGLVKMTNAPLDPYLPIGMN